MTTPKHEISGFDFSAFQRLIANPYDTQLVFDMIRSYASSPEITQYSQNFRNNTEADAGLQALYRDRYVPRFPTNEELLKNPENSLGRLLANFLIKNKISLDFQGIEMHNMYDKRESFYDFARLRTLRAHDILHVLIGAEATPMGEAKVAALQLAQYGTGVHVMTVGFLQLHGLFFDSANLKQYIDATYEGLAIGKKAVPVFGVAWEEYFAEDIGTLRARYGLD